jgi:porin
MSGKSLARVLGLTFVVLLNALPSAADTAAWPEGPYLTGDWGGLRTQVEGDGVDPYSAYTSIVSGNPVGGVRQVGPKYAQDVNFGLTFDLRKLVGWDGATINVNSVDRVGKTIRPAVGSVYDPVQIYGGQTITLYNVTLEQRFWEDKVALKLGRLSPGDDFAESPLYNYYVNNGIDGQIRAVIDDTRFATYPFASWGGRVRFDPTPELNIQTGLFQVSDRYVDRYLHGANFSIKGSDGVQVVQQFGWTPVFGKPADAITPPAQGLPGHYFAGGYWSNSDYAQFGTTAKARISYGFYAHGDQMVYRAAPGSDVGLTLFGTVAYAPQENIAIIPFQLSGGALYQGLAPSRPKDMTIFGVIYGTFSEDYATAVEPNFGARPTREVDLELGYRVQVTDFAYVQPDVQGIVSPGGSGNIPDAFILAAQFGVTF